MVQISDHKEKLSVSKPRSSCRNNIEEVKGTLMFNDKLTCEILHALFSIIQVTEILQFHFE